VGKKKHNHGKERKASKLSIIRVWVAIDSELNLTFKLMEFRNIDLALIILSYKYVFFQEKGM
jgi:hypothetical protein